MDAANSSIRDIVEGLNDEALDFPGLPGEQGGARTNNVSVDAYLALKTAFNELKNRFIESEVRREEFAKRAKRKGRSDAGAASLVQQAQQEKDMIVQKSFAAFQEKYAENEELRKRIANVTEECEELKKECTDKVKELTEKLAENEELQGKLADLTEKYEGLTRTCKERERKLTKEKDAENQELREKLADSKVTFEALENRCKEREEFIKVKIAENEDLQTKLVDSGAKCELSVNELKRKEEECTKQLEALGSGDSDGQKRELECSKTPLGSDGKIIGDSQETPGAAGGCSQTSLTELPLAALLKRIEDYGLQVSESHGVVAFFVSDEEKLKSHLERCEDDSVSSIFGKILSKDSSEMALIFCSQEDFDSLTTKHNEAEGKVLRLRQTIEDQAQEIRRLRKLCSDVMHVHSKCNEEKRSTLESETKGLHRKLEEGLIPKDAARAHVMAVKAEVGQPVDEGRLQLLLKKVVGIIAHLNDLFRELDTQEQLLQQMTDFTQKSTRALSDKATQRFDIEKRMLIDRRLEPTIDDPTAGGEVKYLSMPVEETGMLGGALVASGGEIRRITSPSREGTAESGETQSRPVNSTLSGETASGRAATKHARAGGEGSGGSRPSSDRGEWTGESDIEVIEESESMLGATSMQGRLCPVCEHYFSSSRSQEAFVQHVRSHFDDD